MAEATVTPFPKAAQLAHRGKAKPEKGEETVQSQAAERVAMKRAARVAAKPDDVVGEAVFTGSATELALDKIVEVRNPRVLASANEQKSLNESVKMHGVLQPIRVSMQPDGTFAVVAGHRRFIAAKAAHLKTIPAVVAVIPDDTTAFTQSLVENLQREDLNPIDEAKGLQTLMSETGKTQADVGKMVGKSQSEVSNTLRLLELAEPVRQAIEGGKLSASHGRALVALPQERQVAVAKIAVEQKLASKDVEDRIRREKEDAKRADETSVRHDAEANGAKERLAAFCEKKGLDPTTLTIIVGGYGHDHMRDAFIGAGAQARTELHGDHASPDWPCDEQATTWKYGEWEGTFKPVCTVQAHRDAFVKERDKEKVAAAKVTDKRLAKARSTLERAIRSDEGKGTLNIDGQRLALYVLLTATRAGEYGRSDRPERFVKQYGGLPEGVASAQEQDVIETIKGLSEKDLGEELAKAVTAGMLPNVWSDGFRIEDGWAIRQWIVETFDVEEELVWAGKEPSFAVLESWAKRGRTLTETQQAAYDKVLADRAAWNSRYETPKAVAADDAEPTDAEIAREDAEVGAAEAAMMDEDDESDEDDEDDDEI
jgi:ParB family chromosome partitioning protein